MSILAAQDAAGLRVDPESDLRDTQRCRQQLIQIHRAISRFQSKYDRLPNWLSELVVEGVIGEAMLTCPVIQRTGDPIAIRKEFQKDVFDDPHAYYTPSYAYEFCNAVIPLWPGVTITYADFKMAQREVDDIGDRVPIVRCMSHSQVINLGLDGSLYDSENEWEDLFNEDSDSPDGHAKHMQENLFAHLKPSVDHKRIPKRSPHASNRLINLSAHYNAYIDVFWLQWQQQADLSSLINSDVLQDGILHLGPERLPFDARGLVQLDAKHVLGPFPTRVENIKVPQTLTRLHFLHAAAGAASYAHPFSDKVIAVYRLHYADGTDAVRSIRAHFDVGLWIFDPRTIEAGAAKPIWVAPNEGNLHAKDLGKRCGLYLTTWDNPFPNKEVSQLSLESTLADIGVFVVAVTVEN